MRYLKRLPNINLNPELSPGLLLHYRNLFLLKIKFSKNYIKKKNTTQKCELDNNYKIYGSLISTLMKRSKQYYYSKYFESNLTRIKNSWKGIKSIISMRSSSLMTPILLTFQNKAINNSKWNVNIISNYFSTIGKKTQAKKNIHIKITVIT